MTCEVSVSQTRHSNVLVLLLSCAPWPPIPLYILVRASLRCSLKGELHRVLRDLTFLDNFSNGIAFISQNKNRLSFRRKIFVNSHFEPVNEPTNADANLKKASFIASLIRITVFSCANIIAKGFFNHQLAF